MTFESRQVSWWPVHHYVERVLSTVGSWPTVGTPAWQNLDDNDPAKWAAVLDAGQLWALRIDTLQGEMAQTSREISSMENWTTQRRRMFNHTHRIPRKKAAS